MAMGTFTAGMGQEQLDQAKAGLYAEWAENFKREVEGQGGVFTKDMLAAGSIGWIDGFEKAVEEVFLLILDTVVNKNAARF